MWGSGWASQYQSYYGGSAAFRGGSTGRGRGGRGGKQQPAYRNATWTKEGTSTTASTQASAEAVPGTFKNQSLVVNKDGSTSSTTVQAPPATASTSTRTDKEVDIGGITFIKKGNKLVRKDGPGEAATASTSASTATGTPKKATHGGTEYVRTKNGNLVAADIVKKRKETLAAKLMADKKERLDRLVGIVSNNQAARNAHSPAHGTKRHRGRPKSTKLCKFFQQTGQCTNGLRCPFVHDSNKVAICQQFLRKKCPMSASTCPLSHQPNAHRSPHCVHFPNCKNGIDCPYAHVHVSRDAPLCRDFAEYGWCEAGEMCTQRHAIECPRFAENGVCTKKNCKLPHILRRRNDPSAVTTAAAPVAEAASANPATIERTTESDDSLEEGEEEEDQEPQGISERFQKKRKASLNGRDDFVGFDMSDDEVDESEDDDGESEDVDSSDEHEDHSDEDHSDEDDEDDDHEVAGMLVAPRP